MKRLISMLTCVLLVLAVGCTQNDTEPADVNFLALADEVTVTEDSVIFTDEMSDGPIEVRKNPESVVCLFPSYTTLWYEAGGSVIGCIGGDNAAEVYTEYIGRDITADKNMTVIGNTAAGKNWDIERLIALDPGLIICSTSMNGYSTVIEPAKAAGIQVIAVNYDNFADYLKWFKVFCNLTGNPELWDSVAMQAYNEVASVLKNIPKDQPPRVLAMFAGTTSLKANTPNTVLGEMLSQLGVQNIADFSHDLSAERIDINLETVFAAQPDMILVQCHAGTDMAVAQVSDTYGADIVWNSLDAVKNGSVYYLDKVLFHNKPNSRFAEAYRVLAELLYPDVNF